MSGNDIDISDLIDWEEGLPRPRWEPILTRVESRCEPETRRDAWSSICRQWLAKLGAALGEGYETHESANFILLAPGNGGEAPKVLHFAERCRLAILSVLVGVAHFDDAGKEVVLALRTDDDYYHYLSLFYPEGEHGDTIGVHIRHGYTHIVLRNLTLWGYEDTLAHELTHASLLHLAIPLWLNEGLARMVQHQITGRGLLEVTHEMAREHKCYWAEHGMDEFWYGEGFTRAGEVQSLSYQLAEILMRLLTEDGKPRWFGWVREPQQRLFAFFNEAVWDDCGEAACVKQLGYGLRDLAARFLGDAATAPRPREADGNGSCSDGCLARSLCGS